MNWSEVHKVFVIGVDTKNDCVHKNYYIVFATTYNEAVSLGRFFFSSGRNADKRNGIHYCASWVSEIIEFANHGSRFEKEKLDIINSERCITLPLRDFYAKIGYNMKNKKYGLVN